MTRPTSPRVTISGIPVRFAPSLLLLVAGLLALFWLRLAGTTGIWVAASVSVLGMIGVLVSTLWHELAHATAARRRGVTVTDITLLAVGGVTQLETMAHTPRDDAAIAAAGPWTSLVLGASAGLAATALPLLTDSTFGRALADIAGVLAWWNVALAVFNTLPGAPLDGGRLIRAAVWARTGDRQIAQRVAAHCGQGLSGVLVAGGAWFAYVAPLPRAVSLLIGAAFVLTAVSIGRGATRELSLDKTYRDLPARTGRPVRGDVTARARFGLTVAIVTSASLVVPLPLIEVAPAPVRPIVPLITFDDAQTYPANGDVVMLIVTRGQRATLPAFFAAVHPQRRLVPVDEVFPPGADRGQLRDVNLARFARQFDIAVAVGARSVGVDTEIVSEVVVIHVQPDSPAHGVLRPGDTLLAVNGEDVSDATAVQNAIRSHPVGEPLTVTLRRAGTRQDVTVTPRLNPERNVGELGIAVDTALEALRLPFRIALAEELRIGGPSAGLAVGLTVVERLTDTSLLAGRTIAATGTLDVNGVVGPVGDIPEKMQAAARGQAAVVFVPREQLALAQEHAPDGLTVVGVDTLAEAVTYLTETR